MSDPSPLVPAPAGPTPLASGAASAAAANAYQSVAQSGAITIQDGVDNLRNLMTISTTAIGVAMALYIKTKDPFYLQVITAAQGLVETGTTQLTAIGTAAAGVVNGFPSGS